MKDEIQLPISKLSYSSFTQLLRNPMIFKMREILGVYDQKNRPSGLVGVACHRALRFYYGGDKEFACPKDPVEARPLAKELGLKWLSEQPDIYIDYGKGKKWDRERMLKAYSQAMDIYFAEEPVYNEIMWVEEKLEGELKTWDGQTLPLPAVGKPDLIHQDKNGDYEIIDTKFTESFTDYEEEDPIKIVQAQFLLHLLWASKGIKAKRVLFREVKRTYNKDENEGKPQIRDWAVPFDHEPYRIVFYNLYRDVFRYLSNNPIFLPNLSDPFDGKEAWLIYSQGLISGDMSDVEVVHKVREVAFASKKFVASRLDSELNKNLLPEEKIKVKLAEFGIPVEPDETEFGASIVLYKFKVAAGIKMATIKKHKDDIAKALAAEGEIRILAPIPGTSLVGVEVENAQRHSVVFGKEHLVKGTLNLPVGVDVRGKIHTLPLNEMPHLLIAGATGSGKSVLLHTIIHALTGQMSPADMRLLLIDPKRVELATFAKKPHLIEKPIFEYKGALRAFQGLIDEMERRYKLLEKAGKREIVEYNKSKRDPANKLPYIVCVVDEFADFMLQSRREERKGKKNKAYEKVVEKALAQGNQIPEPPEDQLESVEIMIVRIAQMARAVGIHLIIATQRPSVDVISGLIKANFPSRIALTTSSPTDSIVILGTPGAEKLAGKGDMLFQSPLVRGVQRLQALITE